MHAAGIPSQDFQNSSQIYALTNRAILGPFPSLLNLLLHYVENFEYHCTMLAFALSVHFVCITSIFVCLYCMYVC